VLDDDIGGLVYPGNGDPYTQPDFAVWRFNANDGTQDLSFGGGAGVARVDFSWWYSGAKKWNGSAFVRVPGPFKTADQLDAIAVDSRGRIVVAGQTFLPTPAPFPNGFGSSDPDVHSFGGTSAVALARLNPDGTLDTTFGDTLRGVRKGTVVSYGDAPFDT